jgi:hypothetical protein
MIKRVWIEQQVESGFDPYSDATDVLVETEDGQIWMAAFVTIPYLMRQMELSRDMAQSMDLDLLEMPRVKFVALETPHVIVENLLPDTIEDTVDNLMTLGTFESVFVLHQDDTVTSPGE